MDQFILAVVSAACGLISAGWGAYVSTVHNRGWIEGFGMGLTLGPFGVIVAACMPTLEPKPKSVFKPVPKAEPSSLKRARDDHGPRAEQLRRFLELQPEFGSTAPAPKPEKRYINEEWTNRAPGQPRKPTAD
jgi:hypothetical protein